jgi:hypothetical protein
MTDPQTFPSEAQRIPMSDGHEFETLTWVHHVFQWKPGTRKVAKRKYNRRWRKQARQWVRTQC